jgi:Flp pilus assembly pilin Flp
MKRISELLLRRAAGAIAAKLSRQLGRRTSPRRIDIRLLKNPAQLQRRCAAEQCRSTHRRQFGAIVADTSHVAPDGSINRKYLLRLIFDLAGGVAATLAWRRRACRSVRHGGDSFAKLSGFLQSN